MNRDQCHKSHNLHSDHSVNIWAISRDSEDTSAR